MIGIALSSAFDLKYRIVGIGSSLAEFRSMMINRAPVRSTCAISSSADLTRVIAIPTASAVALILAAKNMSSTPTTIPRSLWLGFDIFSIGPGVSARFSGRLCLFESPSNGRADAGGQDSQPQQALNCLPDVPNLNARHAAVIDGAITQHARGAFDGMTHNRRLVREGMSRKVLGRSEYHDCREA